MIIAPDLPDTRAGTFLFCDRSGDSLCVHPRCGLEIFGSLDAGTPDCSTTFVPDESRVLSSGFAALTVCKRKSASRHQRDSRAARHAAIAVDLIALRLAGASPISLSDVKVCPSAL
jgi:hypothetical protein